MSDTFLYNEEVTAEDLNNISIDLGKADFSFFENDNPTAVSELNNITGDLVSAGVLLTDNRCRVDVVGDKITVDTGIIVFANGAKKRITETQTLTPLADVKSYVYALNDVLNNRITLNVAEAYPTEGDFVALGTVTNGLVESTICSISTAKVKLNTSNEFQVINEDIYFNCEGINFVKYASISGVEIDGYNFIVFTTTEKLDSLRRPTLDYGQFVNGELYKHYVSVDLKFVKNGNAIDIYASRKYSGNLTVGFLNVLLV